ncbi:MAG: hypothetical protein PHU27_12580 [Salinivirgaceae bacterium]|nr:hypothetical protein [Salinivirgaceae bacterium]
MEKRNVLIRILCLLVVASVLSGCQGTQSPNIETSGDTQQPVVERRSELIKQIFYNVPSPLEMAQLIQKSDVDYNNELLSRYGREKEFLTQDYQALNLGVYGADLSYCRVFDQVQESIKYLSSIRYLTQSLQIPQDQSNTAVERLEKNLSNKDSLISVVIELFTNADVYLRESKREGSAVMILVGSWLEGMYIATHLITEDQYKPGLISSLAGQKHSAINMVRLLEPYASENEFRTTILEHLTAIGELFQQVVVKESENVVSVDTTMKRTVLESNTQYIMDNETFIEIKEKFEKVRSIIIKE